METIKKVRELMSGEKGRKLRNSIIILICGICMLVIVWPQSLTDEDGDRESSADSAAQIDDEGAADTALADYYGDTSGYIESLERRLEEILSQVDGVGSVQVMITLENNGEIQVEKDRTSATSTDNETSDGDSLVSGSTNTSEATVMEDTDSGSSPYVTSVTEPAVCGVVVSCEGGGDADVALKISEAVQALFDVPAHKIVVLELK